MTVTVTLPPLRPTSTCAAVTRTSGTTTARSTLSATAPNGPKATHPGEWTDVDGDQKKRIGAISSTVFPAVFISRFRLPGIGRRR